MAWGLGLIIILGLLYLVYAVPELRKVIATVLVLLVGGVGALLYWELSTDKKAAAAIAVDQVELRGFEVYTRTGLRYFRGNVKNLSTEYTIGTFRLRVRAHDCPGSVVSAQCETVGESLDDIKVTVPPGQVRGVGRSVSFTNLPAVENLLWSYEVVSVRADLG